MHKAGGARPATHNTHNKHEGWQRMRASNREVILESAARVVERSGVTAVTLESVAAEAGLTKGGLMYHFKTRDALLSAIHTHLAEAWERTMTEQLDGPAADASEVDRLAAYARASAQAATRAELMFMLEAETPGHAGVWSEVMERWAPSPADSVERGDTDRVIARLAADGLWLYDAISGGDALDEVTRQRIADRLAEMIRGVG